MRALRSSKKLEETQQQLMGACADEYRDIVIGGKSWAPADAARQVAQEKDTHGWIPGPVAAVASLPLSLAELADLYRTSVSISREDESELSGHLPDLHSLPRAEEFEASLSERNRLAMEDLDARSDFSGAARFTRRNRRSGRGSDAGRRAPFGEREVETGGGLRGQVW